MKMGTDRGVTTSIGVILLVGILMLVLSLHQLQVVPAENHSLEVQHSQKVQRQLVDVGAAIQGAASTGDERQESVQLGMHYPVRVWAVNPPPPVGRLSTTEQANGSLLFRNVTAVDADAADYWNTSRRSLVYETRGLTFEAQYHEYQQNPTVVYAHSRVYALHDGNVQVLADGDLVDGRTLTVVTLRGNLSAARTRAKSLDLRPRSPQTTAVRTVRVTGTNGTSPRLRVPTRLNASQWRDLLADELDPNGTEPGRYVTAVEPVSGADAVVLVLEADATYRLRLSSVLVGSRGGIDPTPNASYLVGVSDDRGKLTVGRERTFVVETRDRFNNPVSGVDVTANVTEGGGTFARSGSGIVTATTGSDGRVRFVYDSSGVSAPQNVTLTVRFGSSEARTVEYHFAVGRAGQRPPSVTSTEAPDRVVQGHNFTLVATASDLGRGGVDVVAGEWFRTAAPSGDLSDPAPGAAAPMQSIDGATDEPRERVLRTIDTDGWDLGNHTLSTRAQDGTSQWSSTRNVTVEVVSGLSGFTVSEGTAVDVTTPGAGEADVYSGVRFNLTNEQGAQVNVTGIRVGVAGDTADNLQEEVAGGNQPWREEVYVDGDLQDGWNGTRSQFDLGSHVALDQPAKLSDNATATIFLLVFEQGDSEVDMRNATLTVTVYYEGGQTSFEVPVTKQATESA